MRVKFQLQSQFSVFGPFVVEFKSAAVEPIGTKEQKG
jgi:hypothetical protein